MSKFRLTLLAVAGALALGVAACGGSDSNSSSGGGGSSGGSGAQLGGTINGAGATFPQPVYQEWAARFQEQRGTTVNYQGIGSGGGIAQFTAGTVDFGATDSAMSDDELKAAQAKGQPVHVPTVLGAVTVPYSIDGVEILRLETGMFETPLDGEQWKRRVILPTRQPLFLHRAYRHTVDDQRRGRIVVMRRDAEDVHVVCVNTAA